MKDAELGRDVDFIPLATLTSDTAKSVKALLAAGSTLKLKESSMTQALQTKMRAFHVRPPACCSEKCANVGAVTLVCLCVDLCVVCVCTVCACPLLLCPCVCVLLCALCVCVWSRGSTCHVQCVCVAPRLTLRATRPRRSCG